MRVFNPLTQELYTTTSATITGVTNAAQGVVTVSSIAGLANTNEVIINGIVGMPQLNNRQLILSNVSGSTFKLKDAVTGAYVDTSGYGAYASGGTAKLVYEVSTPWGTTELPNIQWAQDTATMYVVCGTQPPYKISVDASNVFTVATFTRTNDPFQSAGVLTVNGITLGVTTLVSFVSGPTIVPGINYTFAGVVGTVEINGGVYQLTPISGQYQVSLLLGGTAGPLITNAVKISLDTLPGVLQIQLAGANAYCKIIKQEAGFTTVLLYSDVGLALPVIYNGVSSGAFNAYAPVGTFTIQSGGSSGSTGTISEAFGTFGGAVLQAYIKTAGGADIDSSAWTAYANSGTATPAAENPLTVAFYEGRLGYFGTNQRPDCLFLSRAPDNNGNSRYDDFTGGSNADFACFFQLAPTGGSTSFISWARGGSHYLFLGTFGGPYRVSGSGIDAPITPSSINVRQFDTAGCEETMAAGGQQMFFIQRAGVALRSIKVLNPYMATFESSDLCLNAEQIAYSPLQRVILQRGRPDCLWSYRADGQLVGMSMHLTEQNSDTLTGWHRHSIGGSGLVKDNSVGARQTGLDQLWIVSQRTINGATRCFVEIMADDVYFPDPEEFFASSGVIVAPPKDPNQQNTQSPLGSQTLDLQNWMNALWRLVGQCVNGLDAELAYDGSARGTTAAATLTPSAVGAIQVEGAAAVPITLTASQSVFLASDVGSEIWVKPSATTGLGAGRATITAYTSGTAVSAVVTVPFSSTAAVAAGDWYFAVSTFYGFGHLEGAVVAVTADGAVVSEGGQSGDLSYPVITVVNGTVSLPAGNLGQPMRAAIMRCGLPYLGLLQTHNLEMGGRSGPAEAKPRNISEIFARFMNTLGAEFGTSLYKLQKIETRLSDAIADRGTPVFSGLQRLKLEDSWTGMDNYTNEKNVVVVQRLPLPCVIESLDMYYDTSEDQSAP